MKKNAFTLIEMIATIGLLGMLATITITVSVRKINETKESARDAMIQSIELAATKYANENEIEELNNYDNVYITLQTLVEKEYFTESLVDPTTKKNIPLTNEIYITREENGTINSKYNINQRKEPKLTLIGSYNEYIEVGKEYVELGVTAINPNKEDVSSSVTITGTVDTTTPNTYKITYELDNAKITRNVIVYETNLSSKEYYKLTVDLDGGTDTVDYNSKYAAGSKIVLSPPIKDGYIFAGWSVIGKDAIVKGNTLIMGKSTTKVIAKYGTEIFNLTINLNGGNSDIDYNGEYVVGSTLEINNPTKKCYAFAGWTISGTTSSMNGKLFTMGNSDTVLTANWKEKYLYDNGDECSEITGGWEPRAWKADSSTYRAFAPQKNNTTDSMQITPSTAHYGSGVIEVVKDQDLTNLSLLTIDYEANIKNNIIRLSIIDRDETYIKSKKSVILVESGETVVERTTATLDVSEFEGTYDIVISFINAWAVSPSGTFTVYSIMKE